jgi:hypothetical protein
MSDAATTTGLVLYDGMVQAIEAATTVEARLQKAKAGRPPKNPSPQTRDLAKTIGEMGLTYDQSSRWQNWAGYRGRRSRRR